MTIMGWAPQQGAAGGSLTFEACGRGYIAIYIMVKHLMEILLSALFVTNVPPQVQVGYRPSPRPRGSARRKTASSLILRGHF